MVRMMLAVSAPQGSSVMGFMRIAATTPAHPILRYRPTQVEIMALLRRSSFCFGGFAQAVHASILGMPRAPAAFRLSFCPALVARILSIPRSACATLLLASSVLPRFTAVMVSPTRTVLSRIFGSCELDTLCPFFGFFTDC